MRMLAIVLGAIGIIVAATNIWQYFIQWLTILGVLVPPIGAITLVDQYLLRRDLGDVTDWRPTAFIAWVAGSLVALIVEFNAPYLSTAISSFLVAAVVYYVVSAARATRAS
jgi:cytosine permease